MWDATCCSTNCERQLLLNNITYTKKDEHQILQKFYKSSTWFIRYPGPNMISFNKFHLTSFRLYRPPPLRGYAAQSFPGVSELTTGFESFSAKSDALLFNLQIWTNYDATYIICKYDNNLCFAVTNLNWWNFILHLTLSS